MCCPICQYKRTVGKAADWCLKVYLAVVPMNSFRMKDIVYQLYGSFHGEFMLRVSGEPAFLESHGVFAAAFETRSMSR